MPDQSITIFVIKRKRNTKNTAKNLPMFVYLRKYENLFKKDTLLNNQATKLHIPFTQNGVPKKSSENKKISPIIFFSLHILMSIMFIRKMEGKNFYKIEVDGEDYRQNN